MAALDATELASVAAQARQADQALAGGASTVTISTTTIIIALLVLILIIVAVELAVTCELRAAPRFRSPLAVLLALAFVTAPASSRSQSLTVLDVPSSHSRSCCVEGPLRRW